MTQQSLCSGATWHVSLPLQLPGNQRKSEARTKFVLRPIYEVFHDQEHFQ